MTEIKIPLTKLEVKKYSGSDKPSNMERLDLKVNSTFNFNEVYEKVPLTSFLTEMALNFVDSAEKEIFDNLLDENKISFELIFEKEKVDFYVIGKEDREADKTKFMLDYFPEKDNGGKIEINFEPKFAGTVRITSSSGKDKQPNKENKELTDLKNQIKSLEDQIKNLPSSDVNGQRGRKENLHQLKLQLKEKEKERQEKKPKGDGFLQKPIVIGGLIVGGVAIVLLIILLIKKIIKG